MSRALVPWDLDTPEHRDYFDRWGDGLVVVFPPERGGGAYRGPPHGGAWLHVGADGRVRAATVLRTRQSELFPKDV